MNTEPPILAPALPIRGDPSGAGQGLLGPLLINKDRGYLYALTSAQLVPPRSHLVIAGGRSAGARISIGAPITGLSIESDIQDSHALIAAVPLGRHEIDPGSHPVQSARPGANNRDIAPAPLKGGVRWMGHFLNIHSQRGHSMRARVVSADSQFAMPNPLTGNMVTFDNALELRSLDDGPLVVPGDVGSIVTTPAGIWLGIVVAGRRDVAYVAPLEPIMARLGLSFIGVDEIKAHNRRLAEERERAAAPEAEEAAVQVGRSPEVRGAVASAHLALAG